MKNKKMNRIENYLFEITKPTATGETTTTTIKKTKTVRMRLEGKWIEFEVDEDSGITD